MPESAPVPYEYSFTAGSDTADRLARAMWKETRPRVLVLSGLFGVVIFAAVARSTFTAIGVVAAFVIAGVVSMAIYIVIRRVTVRRYANATSSWAPPGAELRTGFGPDRIAIKTALAEAQLGYHTFSRLSVHDGAVILKQGRQQVYNVLPVELFPDDVLMSLRARIAGQQSVPGPR